MLTAENAMPHALLRPYVHWYVQREMALDTGGIVEPVIPRTGAMLEFQFAAMYDVKEYGSETLRPSWPATVIGPISARRVRLILREQVQSLVPLRASPAGESNQVARAWAGEVVGLGDFSLWSR